MGRLVFPLVRRAAATAFAAVLATSTIASAGPTVIHEDALPETAISPGLGRGFSLSTNSYRGSCLADVKGTAPSYDFDYTFEVVKTTGADRLPRRGVPAGLRSASKAGGERVAYDVLLQEWSAARKRADPTGAGRYHHLLATVSVNVYYESLDEKKATLTPAAMRLLQDKDIAAFFDACGMHYVRSINRQSRIYALFTYEAAQPSLAFEDKLKSAIRSLSIVTTEAPAVRDDVDEIGKAAGKNLQISMYAVGLGRAPEGDLDLTAHDIQGFKRTIMSAVKSTMPSSVGRLSSFEVFPWIENAEFQAMIRLVSAPAPVFDGSGHLVVDRSDPDRPVAKLREMPPYTQKRILQTNVEFLAALDRAGRVKLEAYKVAKACRAQLRADFMAFDPATGAYAFAADAQTPAYAIHVVRASYGANCNAKLEHNETAALAAACDGDDRCDYQIARANIGDPEVGCAKAYTVEWQCGAPAAPDLQSATIDGEADGKSLTLACRPAGAEPSAVALTMGQTRFAYHHGKTDRALRLGELDQALTDEALKRTWREYDDFMYGDDDEAGPDSWQPGADSTWAATDGGPARTSVGRCLRELFDAGITLLSYRHVPACTRLQLQLSAATEKIADFCMPTYQRGASGGGE